MDNAANAQRLAVEQGKHFEQTCEMALKYAGFEIADRHVTFTNVGVEVDIIVTNRHNIAFYSTCKGSMRGTRPGVKRTDTLKKALCDVFLLSDYGWSPILLLTSHVPLTGNGRAMLNAVERSRLFDVLSPWRHGERLRWLANATEDMLRRDLYTPHRELIERQWAEGQHTYKVPMIRPDDYKQPSLFPGRD